MAGTGMAFSARGASPMHSSRSPTKARGSSGQVSPTPICPTPKEAPTQPHTQQRMRRCVVIDGGLWMGWAVQGSRAGSRAGSAGSSRPAWQGRCSDDVGYV